MYLDITKEYPDTICGEASECYLIKVLCHLSNPAFIKEAAKRYDIILNQLEDAKAQLRDAKRTGVAPPFRVGLEAYVDRLAYCVKMFEKTPMGRKALQQAEERAERFIEKNKYGLYRGEVLLDIGAAHLVSNFDLENGEKWLNRAAEWFDSVHQFDKDLKEFELPEQVKRVAAPPKDERFKDRWENIRLSQPKPGDVFNRRTCKWYWNSKRKDVCLIQGLVEYAKSNVDEAETHWAMLAELDKEFYAQQRASGWEDATPMARLLWSARNKDGALYAKPEEMAAFTIPKRRLAVWLADFLYMSERPSEALSIYRRLELGELGTMTKEETAYVTCGVFASMCWDRSLDEIKYLEPKLRHFIGTPSETRALLGYANRLRITGQYVCFIGDRVIAFEKWNDLTEKSYEQQVKFSLRNTTFKSK